MRARRRDIHDSSPPGLDHVGQHRLDHVEDAVEVDVDHPLPVLERDVVETVEAVQARGVDQNRHRPQPGANRRQRGIHLRSFRYVGGESEIGFRRSEVDGRDVQTVGAQPLRDGQADTGSAAGDNRGLHAEASTPNVAVSATKNVPYNYENLTLGPERRATWPRNLARPALRGLASQRLSCPTAGQRCDPVPENFLNYRDANVRFAEEENEIFVTVTALGGTGCQRRTRPTD